MSIVVILFVVASIPTTITLCYELGRKWRARGRIRILFYANKQEPYQVQRLGLFCWHNAGEPRRKVFWARQWAKHLIEQERERRKPKQALAKVIEEYEV